MFELSFYPLEADGAGYPKPKVPMLAQPSLREWFGRSDLSGKSAFMHGGESFASGRYALAEAMRRAGAGPGTAVLLPAFHCRAIVEPALYLNIEPRFYPVLPDLSPDYKALSNMIDVGATPVAMILTHYFGFPNALEEARSFCNQHDIALIEDCAHALYGEVAGRLLGSVGDYGTASLWKFLPVQDGAVLLDNTGSQPPHQIKSPSLFAEIRGIGGLLEAWSERVLRNASLLNVDKAAIMAEAEHAGERRHDRVPESGLKEFVPELIGVAALRSSRWLAANATHGYVTSKRRENYLRWLEGMRGLPGVAPLFPNLPDGVVPYAFPLLLESPESDFHILKTAGIPFWRWEDMAITGCSTSRDYRLRLLQLPCHQNLADAELEWMIACVTNLMS